MKEYHFKYQNAKGGLYFILAIFGPFLIVLPSIFLLDSISWIFWINIPLIIFCIIYFLLKFHKASIGNDCITVDDEGFSSKDYGRVRYSDIHSIPPYGPLQAPPPSMRIRLHNGKKLVWQLNSSNPKAKDDVMTFIAFREAMLGHLRQQTETASPEDKILTTPEAEWIANSKAPQVPETTTAEEVIEQLESHKKRDFKYKYIAIPVASIFAILIFVRTCGVDMIREHKAKEFEGVRKMIMKEETNYIENVQKALSVAKAYTQKFGTIYLFTNDTQASAEYMPDIRKDPYLPEINVVGLRRTEDNKLLEKFIAHPDSVSYDLAIINRSMKFSALMSKSVFAEEDSTAAVVYFSVYNPHESLPSTFRQRSDTTFRPIRYLSSINIPKNGKLKKQLLENMDFASVRAILHEYENTYFYMAVKESDGISPERFEELKKLVSADFEDHGIDVDAFQSKRFNE